MSAIRRAAVFVLTAAVLAASCTGTPAPEAPPAPPTGPAADPGDLAFSIKVPAGPAGEESSTAALRRLCRRPAPEDHPPARAQDPPALPGGILRIVNAVEQARGRRFLETVRAEAVSRKELRSKLLSLFDLSFPDRVYDRRTAVWQTIGILPAGVSIRGALEDFASTDVIGFYVPSTDELYFAGSGRDPGFIGGVTLAHELTHAMDDQHFDLSRLDDLEAACRDDRYQAALGAIEGSAQFFSARVAVTAFSQEEALEAIEDLPADSLLGPEGQPPFIRNLQLWPYFAGADFMTSRDTAGGVPAVDAALERFPVSTEQVIHPEKYPDDRPRAIEVPDAGPALGKGWDDIDVMDVGEAWLQILLETELDPGGIEGAAAGWDGGRYRAWSDGEQVAVAIGTVWDSPGDAGEFAAAMRRYVDEVGRPADVRVEGDRVWTLIATQPRLIDTLRTAI